MSQTLTLWARLSEVQGPVKITWKVQYGQFISNSTSMASVLLAFSDQAGHFFSPNN